MPERQRQVGGGGQQRPLGRPAAAIAGAWAAMTVGTQGGAPAGMCSVGACITDPVTPHRQRPCGDHLRRRSHRIPSATAAPHLLEQPRLPAAATRSLTPAPRSSTCSAPAADFPTPA